MTTRVSPPGTEADYHDYLKVLTFILVWLTSVVVVVSMIDGPAPQPVWQTQRDVGRGGYSYSLILLALPLSSLLVWYWRSREALELKAIMRAVRGNVIVTALMWIVLDVSLAHKLFNFPNANATKLPAIWWHRWEGACDSIWTLLRPACYERQLPSEEVLFYLGGAGLLTMMYMWATEDFFSQYRMQREQYLEAAKKAVPLVEWNRKLIAVAFVFLVTGIAVKKLAPWHNYHAGWPIYFIAELAIVFIPLAALYTRVRRFTNTRAFLFVLLVQIVVSLIWEATLALPYGWWNYNMAAMIGIQAIPWSNLAIEACGLWLSVAWSVMLVYEATKIKALLGRSWRQILIG